MEKQYQYKWVSAVCVNEEIAAELNDLESKYHLVFGVRVTPISQSECLIVCQVQDAA